VEKMLKDLDQVGRAYIKTQGGTESQYLETVRKRDARYARILSPRGENDKEGK